LSDEKIDWQGLLEWCRRHVSDISGWTFLLWLWVTGSHPRGKFLATPPEMEMFVVKTVRWSRETMPGHEAVWWFVREAIVAEGLLGEKAREEVIAVVREYEGELKTKEVLDEARERDKRFIARLFERVEQVSRTPTL
jgi:hypothetical protein